MTGPRIVFLHSSDELYGADRIVLALLDLLPPGIRAEVWLPTDVPHSASPLCVELTRRQIAWRHVDLPVLRRAYRRPRELTRLARRWVSLVRALRRARPALVHCTTSAVLPGALAARLAGVPRVSAHVQEFWSAGDRRMLTPLARTAHRLVAISPAVAAALPITLRARTHVLLNATDDPGPPEPLAGRTGPVRYVVASRWNGWKGHGTLLAAWAAAGSPGRLTVLGGMPSSGTAVDVAALAARLPDPSTVTIAGEVADIAAFVRAADVLVVPSDLPEPFGLVAIEAFAAGRPVIASAAGGLADIVTDGAGWLFPRRDTAALAALFAGLDRATVERAGTVARARYEDRFTMARFADQWRDELAQLLPSPETTECIR